MQKIRQRDIASNQQSILCAPTVGVAQNAVNNVDQEEEKRLDPYFKSVDRLPRDSVRTNMMPFWSRSPLMTKLTLKRRELNLRSSTAVNSS